MLYINPLLLSPRDAADDGEHIAELFDALGIKTGQYIGILTGTPDRVTGVFYGFRKSNYGYWIAIGNRLERCQNITSIGPSRSMRGGAMHTNWHRVDYEA